MKIHIILLISLFIINFNEAFGSWGGGSYGEHPISPGARGSRYDRTRNTQQLSHHQQNTRKEATNPIKPPGRGLGVSAWGIVALIVGVILTSAGAYYAFIFYPLLCKKERNYDKIELPNV